MGCVYMMHSFYVAQYGVPFNGLQAFTTVNTSRWFEWIVSPERFAGGKVFLLSGVLSGHVMHP